MAHRRYGMAATLAAALLFATAGYTAEGGGSAGATAQANWRHVKTSFGYFGFTSFYTCSGIESQVQEILRLFGARKGAKVYATACERGENRPSRNATVNVEFDALTTAAATEGAEPVAAHWVALEIRPNRPSRLQEGDCELIEQMRDVLTKNFEFKQSNYRATCVPKQMTLNSYLIRGEVLKPVEAAKKRS